MSHATKLPILRRLHYLGRFWPFVMLVLITLGAWFVVRLLPVAGEDSNTKSSAARTSASPIYGIQLTADGRSLFVSTGKSEVHRVSMDDGELTGTWYVEDAKLASFAVSSDLDWIAFGGYDGRFCLENIHAGDVFESNTARLESNYAVSFSPDSQSVAVGGKKQLTVWEVATGEMVANCSTNEAVRFAQFSPLGDSILIATNSAIKLWKLHTDEIVWQARLERVILTGFAVSWNQNLFALGGSFGLIQLRDLTDGSLLAETREPQIPILALAFDPAAQTLVSGLIDGSIVLRDSTDLQEEIRWAAHKRGTRGLQFNSEGTTLISGGFDGIISVWDRETLAELQRFDVNQF